MMAALCRGIFIVSAKRTPFGAFGGKLKDHSPTTLQELAAKAALVAGNVKPEIVDSVVVGNVISCSSTDTAYISRHVSIRCGIPFHVPALTVNRLCGSGFQSIVNGAQDIQLGTANVVLTGGSENMSMAPYAVRNTRFGIKLGDEPKQEDTLWASLTDAQIKTPMGITAENLSEKYKLTREECDEFAFQSQTKWQDANKAGRFKEEMAPITVKVKKQEVSMDTDEHPRLSTLEQLAKLPTVFKKGGTVTAANASGICDGAGAVIISSEAALKKNNLKPLARLVAYSYAGCDPRIMGIGPVPAIQNLLAKTNIKLADIDLIEVNEAFAAQTLSVMKELGIDADKFNVDGGAIALGHPLAASGSRITAHLVHELKRRGGRYAIGSACIGGGQGIALLIENVK
uniref:3-ketoacyl-CoA thiolase, mitochondrial n=1 Tax=Strigamia maritima TaxID=126957 RepID=T1J3D9_STRMM